MVRASNLKKLEDALRRYHELQEKLADPAVISDQDHYQKSAKEFAALTPIIETHRAYEEVGRQLLDVRHMLEKEKDLDLRQMIESELKELEPKSASLEEDLHQLFNPKKEEKDLDVIMEIRAGTGGLEASLFAGDLYRMYTKYALMRKWKIDPIAISEAEKGFKELVFSVSGKGAWKRLHLESGTHRVQRVPETEASGRIHTSAATVAVLSEAEDIDIKIEQKDLKVDVFRSSGPGGQSVNTCDSAVRITHLPTNTVVVSQDERSQLKNKAKCMRVLRARILDKMKQDQSQKEAADRKAQVGSGDRSEKIRTYNFPDNRVTDHRIGFTTHQLASVMEGEMDEVIDALLKAEEDKALAE
ncbi:MAG: peptide chain release factor 1 [Candidatus Omnitrophica bacterium]|nr:peptide chain release factor 1 [Candidatus Omnitrophota bacterium]